MIKNQTILEIKKNDRIYQLSLSADSPLGEVFDVLTEMRGFVIDRIREASVTEVVKTDQPDQIEE